MKILHIEDTSILNIMLHKFILSLWHMTINYVSHDHQLRVILHMTINYVSHDHQLRVTWPSTVSHDHQLRVTWPSTMCHMTINYVSHDQLHVTWPSTTCHMTINYMSHDHQLRVTWPSLRVILHMVLASKCLSFFNGELSLSFVSRPHPAHTRRRGLVSQVQILGLVPETWSGQSNCRIAFIKCDI